MGSNRHISRCMPGWNWVWALVCLGLAFGIPAYPAMGLSTGESLANRVDEPFFGDFDEMQRDKVIRVLTPFSLTSFYILEGKEKGWVYEYLREFEDHINKSNKQEKDRIHVLLIPSSRDQLIAGLLDGHGDIVATDLTITPGRLESIDFSIPIYDQVRELIITGGDTPAIAALKDVSGTEIHVRESASYFESLQGLNDKLRAENLDPVVIKPVAESLEDEDLLEMVDKGLIPAIVMDEHAARLWSKLYQNILIHEDFPLRDKGEIAWAFRKNSPLLKEVVNGFLDNAKVGTTLGNILAKRYYSDVNALINPKTENYRKELGKLRKIFSEIGAEYGIDPMLLAAQAFQESRFNHKAKSKAGAVGIMQILPSTAEDKNVAITGYRSLEGNIEAGAKYMRFLADRYFSDPEIGETDRILFAFAAYNAGPARVVKARSKASDPNTWFDSVEWEVARAAGSEPVRYVKNIYIYYIAFRDFEARDAAVSEMKAQE